MPGISIKISHVSRFNDPSKVHDGNTVSYACYQAQIVRNEEHRHLKALPKVQDKIYDLGGNCHVESCGRLIGNEKLWPAGHGHGDHNPLTHSSAELIGKCAKSLFWIWNADKIQQPKHLRMTFCLRKVPMATEYPGKLRLDSENRVEALAGVLKDHRDFTSAQFLHLSFIERRQILARPNYIAPDVSIRFKKLQQGQRKNGLSASGLAHQGEYLSCSDLKVNAIHRTDLPRTGSEFNMQIAHF
jgi:hypothetical protein